MRQLIEEIETWRRQGFGVALATVVKVWGSAPRPLGSKMAMRDDGQMAGSVSGGCIEAAVCQEAERVLASGQGTLVSYGVEDEEAWSLGLSCGGEIEVFIERWPEVQEVMLEAIRRSITDQELVALATVVAGPDIGYQLLVWPGGQTLGDLGSPRLNQRAALYAEQLIPTQQCGRKTFDRQADTVDVFFEVLAPPPKLVVIGAVHVAAHLIEFAGDLGFETILVDPRSAFLEQERFANADQLVGAWPQEALSEVGIDESTFVAVLSHDPKIDLPAIESALRSPARYIGVLGSKKSHRKRVSTLLERGFSDEELRRLHAPIGLDLGGRRAVEIALAIAAQMVAVHHGQSGSPKNAG